jgi:hypothetical protein
MLPPAAELTSPSLISRLEKSLQALSRLQSVSEGLRSVDKATSAEMRALSPKQLDCLQVIIRQGELSLTRRLKKLVSDNSQASRPAVLGREEAGPSHSAFVLQRSVDDSPSRELLTAFRAACRSLCASLQEARRACDSSTTVMLSTLLQRMEKQLWLLESSQERPRVGLPTINLFLSC